MYSTYEVESIFFICDGTFGMFGNGMGEFYACD
jgi:hypothetical protein